MIDIPAFWKAIEEDWSTGEDRSEQAKRFLGQLSHWAWYAQLFDCAVDFCVTHEQAAQLNRAYSGVPYHMSLWYRDLMDFAPDAVRFEPKFLTVQKVFYDAYHRLKEKFPEVYI